MAKDFVLRVAVKWIVEAYLRTRKPEQALAFASELDRIMERDERVVSRDRDPEEARARPEAREWVERSTSRALARIG